MDFFWNLGDTLMKRLIAICALLFTNLAAYPVGPLVVAAHVQGGGSSGGGIRECHIGSAKLSCP